MSLRLPVAVEALELEGIDECGLSELDRKLLKIIILNYKGGPAGIEALAATLQLETDVLLEVVEPYLLKMGFLIRTSQGRKTSDKANDHLTCRVGLPAMKARGFSGIKSKSVGGAEPQWPPL